MGDWMDSIGLMFMFYYDKTKNEAKEKKQYTTFLDYLRDLFK